MFENVNRKKIIISVILLVIVISGGIYYFIESSEKMGEIQFQDDFYNIENAKDEEAEVNTIIEEKRKIVVDICGQVVSPGVITLEEGARIIDAINLAGGATKEANLNKVNLAYILSDAQKIYIPSINESQSNLYILDGSGEDVVITEQNNNKKEVDKIMININTANEEELQKLPGIGQSISERIIQYRKENGKFKIVEDIKNVSGIGDSKFNSIKDFICIK